MQAIANEEVVAIIRLELRSLDPHRPTKGFRFAGKSEVKLTKMFFFDIRILSSKSSPGSSSVIILSPWNVIVVRPELRKLDGLTYDHVPPIVRTDLEIFDGIN